MSGAAIAHWWRIGFCGLGILFIVFSLVYYLRGRARQGVATRSWQRTTATILSASTRAMEQVQRVPGATWFVVRTGISYLPEVEYSYEANGSRRGRRAFLNGRTFYAVEQAEAWLATMQPGTETNAWYDPQHPDDSALVITSPLIGVTIIGLLTGVGLIVVGLTLAGSFMQ